MSTSPTSRGHLLCLPSGNAIATRLQHDRNWTCQNVDDVAEAIAALHERPRNTVVLAGCASELSTDDLLAWAHAGAKAPAETSPGLLFGTTPRDLDNLASRFEVRPRILSSEKQPVTAPRSDIAFLGARMVARFEAPPEETLRALYEPADLRFIAGHSNGIDMNAGPATLCCQPDQLNVPDDDFAVYPCFRGVECARCRPTQGRATPSMLRTRVVLLVSCWGVTTSNAVFTPAYTIGHGLLMNPHLAVLITTVRAAVIDALDVPYLYYLANKGLSMGEVANRANQLRLARGLAADFICFGDPEVRLGTSLAEAVAERHGGGIYRARLPSSTGRSDVSIALPEGSVPEEPIVLVAGNPDVAGAYVPGGPLDLTVPPDTTEVIFTLADRRSLQLRGDVGGLAADLRFVSDYVRALAAHGGSGTPTIALRAVEMAQTILENNPLQDLTTGSVLSVEGLQETSAQLERALAMSAQQVTLACVAAVRELGIYPYSLWKPRYERIDERAGGRCGGCGGTCDVHVFRTRTREAIRSIVSCRACGPIFEGDPALGTEFAVKSASLARDVRIEVPVTNPYGFPVPVSGVAVVSAFRLGQCAAGAIRAARLLDGASSILPLEVTVPPEFHSGVLSLSCCLMIGGRLQYLRRVVHLSSARPEILQQTSVRVS